MIVGRAGASVGLAAGAFVFGVLGAFGTATAIAVGVGVSAALVPFLVAVALVGSSAVPHANPKANGTHTTTRFIPRSYHLRLGPRLTPPVTVGGAPDRFHESRGSRYARDLRDMTLDAPNTQGPSEGFVAGCVTCGAPLHLVLGDRVGPCRHCGTPTPLDGPTRSRLAEATRRIEKVTFFEHLRLIRRGREAETVLVLGGIGVSATWIVLGGGAYLACHAALPDGVSALDVLRSAELGGQSPSVAWTLLSLVVGFGISLGWVLGAFARARGAGAPPRALPPLEGGAPRCRLCGAGLPDPGVVRVCRHCSARNLVDGRNLDRHVGDVLERLQDLERLEAEVVARADETVESTVMWSALFALLGPPLAALVGAWTQTWDPRLFGYAWLAYLPAALAALVLLARTPHRARRFVDTRPGELLRVGGETHRVHAVLHDVHPFTGCQTLHCVGPAEASFPTLALEVSEYPELRVRAFHVESGGPPLSTEEVARLGELRVETASGSQDSARAIPKESPLRIFAANATPGASPIWLLRPSEDPIRHVFAPGPDPRRA